MKKILLTLICAVMCMASAFAQTELLCTNMGWDAGATANLPDSWSAQGYNFAVAKNDGSTAPAYNKAGDVRLYAANTITISSTPAMTKIVFNISAQGKKRLAPITASTGTIEAQAAGDATVTWTGNAESVTFTVGDKADFGSEEGKAGQLDFNSVVITGGGEGGSTTPVEPGDEGVVTLLGADNADGAADWTLEANNLPEGLTYVWQWKSYNGAYYLNGSAYANNTAYAVEEYAYSAAVKLEADGDAKMNFEHAAKFQTTLKALCYVAVREEGATTWTKLEIPTWPAEGSWDFVNSGDIDLSAYKGKSIQIGFHYGSSAEGADTWEIRNLKVSTVNAGTVTPPAPVYTAYKLVKDANDLISGAKYVFNLDGNKVAGQLGETQTYGRPNLVACSFENGDLMTDANKAYTLTKEDAGWTIKDDFGRFYIMDAEHATFQVAEAATGEGCFWDFEAAENNTWRITNDLRDNFAIGREGTFSTFTPFNIDEATEYALPVLYIDSIYVGVENVASDANAPVEYFNLQGIRVAQPEAGLYIRRQGSSVTKILVK
ncbi:MAG: DUF5017 domain-containing protein [Muribaculaceae bacterium]|nr:DUF5017 domain-containing protein [Muribaculaceae bacterium]